MKNILRILVILSFSFLISCKEKGKEKETRNSMVAEEGGEGTEDGGGGGEGTKDGGGGGERRAPAPDLPEFPHTKTFKTLSHILNEILENEKNYLENLKRLIEGTEAKAKEGSFLAQASIKAKKIESMHKSFNATLIKIEKEIQEKQKPLPKVEIAKEFCQSIRYLITQPGWKENTLWLMQEHTILKEDLEINSLDLKNELITPIQRFSRYKMYLESLIKYLNRGLTKAEAQICQESYNILIALYAETNDLVKEPKTEERFKAELDERCPCIGSCKEWCYVSYPGLGLPKSCLKKYTEESSDIIEQIPNFLVIKGDTSFLGRWYRGCE